MIKKNILSVVIVTLILSVMGTAVGDLHMVITPPSSTDITPGGTHISYNVNLKDLEGSNQVINADIKIPDIHNTDLEFQFEDLDANWYSSGEPCSWASSSTEEDIL